jgi:F-type H+-transporting ATPase subunit gamma
LPKLLQKRKAEKTVFILVTSDKGLAGSFNSAIIRLFERYVKDFNINLKDPKYSVIVIGKKALTYAQSRGLNVVEKFVRVGDYTTPDQTNPISDYISNGYLNKNWDLAIVFSTYFKTALKQEVLSQVMLPISLESIKKTIDEIFPKTGKFAELALQNKPTIKIDNYKIEPSPKKVLEQLAVYLIRMKFYHLILETNASEHAARRVAMKNASDNAKELFTDLSLVYNKSRQANITKEITEIVSSIESLNK